MKRLPGITLILLLLFAFCGDSSAIVRDWTLQKVSGGEFKLSENLGDSGALLMFWATYCKPCKKEFNQFEEKLNFFADSLGVKVVLISVDGTRSKSKVKPFLKSKGFKWPAVYDSDKAVFKMYGGNKVLPFTVLLDSEGNTFWTHLAELKSIDELTEKIHELTGRKSE